MEWRRACLAALLAVLVEISTLPLAAYPLVREFPRPFVKDGTIDYNGDGIPDIAIIIGGQGRGVAPEDVKAAALIGAKIGSHLYYTTGPAVAGNETGTFAGVHDRFENVTGNWTGTTLLDEYNRDVTPPDQRDQRFEGEDVFSFLKAPLVWTDYEFLDENYEVVNPDLADKNLILIGGPAVNRAVDYLNDTGRLWIVYVGNRLYDMRFYHDGFYEDEGYVDLERVRTWFGDFGAYLVDGVGVIQYAKDDPWGEEKNYILVVAGNNRYGTYAAAVALADPTKVVRGPWNFLFHYCLAGTDEEHPPALIVVALVPGKGVAAHPFSTPPEHDNVVEIVWPKPVTVEPVVSPRG